MGRKRIRTPEEIKERARKVSKEWYEKYKDIIAAQRSVYGKINRRENPEKRMLLGAKQRAKERGLEFNITLNDIVIPTICPILKVPFEIGTSYAPSLDRIDPSKGYLKGNVWVITRKANVMKNNATLQELKDFSNWVLSLSQLS